MLHSCIHSCIHPYIHPSIHSFIHSLIHSHSFIHSFIHSFVSSLFSRYAIRNRTEITLNIPFALRQRTPRSVLESPTVPSLELPSTILQWIRSICSLDATVGRSETTPEWTVCSWGVSILQRPDAKRRSCWQTKHSNRRRIPEGKWSATDELCNKARNRKGWKRRQIQGNWVYKKAAVLLSGLPESFQQFDQPEAAYDRTFEQETISVQGMRQELQALVDIINSHADPLGHAPVWVSVLWQEVSSEVWHEEAYLHPHGREAPPVQLLRQVVQPVVQSDHTLSEAQRISAFLV